ncbi:sulfite exporter TauE/SafE family protein [Pseudoalteromonas fenneropenaei]|uniref:Probable membrane transporter protein n=1 Tax=Pseudoalteromonas fenneropenaei TaxID=1737459 RepID=A0ABV7CPB8_9GAMM
MLQRAFSLSQVPVWFVLAVYCSLMWLQGAPQALQSVIAQWQIALTMALGSFVAGGTALGGGAVAFPVMTKLLAIEPATAKVFSLAIQSFGMTAATITILCRRIPIYTNVVVMALPMAFIGVWLSLHYIAPYAPRLLTKSIFSLLLLCFAVTLIYRWWRKAHHLPSHINISPQPLRFMLVALFGGVASGLVGSGADIAIFALLVLVYHADVKRATATSVVIMAFTSVLGSSINAWQLQVIDAEIQGYLLAAIPIVVIGAPLGAYVCARIKVAYLVSFLLALIALEVLFTLLELVAQA